MVTDDIEFYERQSPFPLSQLVEMALLTRQYVNRRFWGREDNTNAAAGRAAASGASLYLCALYVCEKEDSGDT